MTLVVDSSIALKWVIAERDSHLAAKLIREDLCAPWFVYLECANVLWRTVQQKMSTDGQAKLKLTTLRLA